MTHSAVSSARLGRRKSDVFGIRVHNLILSRDSGDDYFEFRVQCEIRLPVSDAKGKAQQVLASLAEPLNMDSLREVEEIVTPYIHEHATENFRETIRRAFRDLAEYAGAENQDKSR